MIFSITPRKIFSGANPAELRVKQSTKFDFIINFKAATQSDLTVPPDVLAQANQVIE